MQLAALDNVQQVLSEQLIWRRAQVGHVVRQGGGGSGHDGRRWFGDHLILYRKCDKMMNAGNTFWRYNKLPRLRQRTMPSQLLSRSAVLAALIAAGAAQAAGGIIVQVSDTSGKPVADAVVYLEADGGAPLPKPQKPGEISQKGLKFIPLVTVIQTGSKIFFPNNDKVRHHIYSFSPPHKFDQKLYTGTTAEPQTFEKPGTVVLGCNIHDKMIAYVRIVDTPYFGKTDASGAVAVDAPAGRYVLKAWHPDIAGGNAQEQAVRLSDGTASASFKMSRKPPSTSPDAPAY